MNKPKILIVDDEPFNVDYLEQELEDLGYGTVTAFNGREALEQVEAESPDVILLDIMMPEIDGFAVLEQLKANKVWRDIPVIVISAMNDLDSIVRGTKLGAADYLPKPFNETLLHARIESSLERKRWRDKEIEYLQQVEQLIDAAQAIENKTFAPEHVSPVAAREDALGNLARVFQHMAQEVHNREQRLERQIQQLRLDMAERHKAALETVAVYLPVDRRLALAAGQSLPDRADGAVLFADVSGFTPLTEALAHELGFHRGAEELTRQLDRVFGVLIDEVHRYGGSVIGFSGDAITCWFDRNPGFAASSAALRAAACALGMQAAIGQFMAMTTPAGSPISLAIKTAVVAGPVRRFLIGDPHIQQLEVLAGQTLDKLACGEHLAGRGELLVQSTAVDQAGEKLVIGAWRSDPASGQQFAVVTALTQPVPSSAWPAIPAAELPEVQLRSWVPAPVYDKLSTSQGLYLAELRVVTALFLQFHGIDYEGDEAAGSKLDAFVRWVQNVLARRETAYQLMLFAQRRQLHRAVAEWHEQTYAADLTTYYPLLAHHWGQAEDPAKTIHYLEKAGEEARRHGNYQQALQYYDKALALEAQDAVLSMAYSQGTKPQD